METPLSLAVVGVGRIGVFHAEHIQELSQENGTCRLRAVVDGYRDTAKRVAERLQSQQRDRIHFFDSVDALVDARLIDCAVVASRTEHHFRDARTLIDAGYRVLVEKPLTDKVEVAIEFVRYLARDATKKRALMQAFMRRFDEPLQRVKQLLEQDRIGRPFKVVSVLEDPLPPPDGYASPGILPDMAVHNIDEVIWLLGAKPVTAASLGANLHSFQRSAVKEDFDDVFLQMWFPGQVIAQVQVSRNHVAGYRNETWVFGERGVIHVGHFQANRRTVSVEAFDPHGTLETKTFPLRDYGSEVPVFIQRFGQAYKRELADFVAQCLRDELFSVTQEDGLTAMQVATFAMESATDIGKKICYEGPAA